MPNDEERLLFMITSSTVVEMMSVVHRIAVATQRWMNEVPAIFIHHGQPARTVALPDGAAVRLLGHRFVDLLPRYNDKAKSRALVVTYSSANMQMGIRGVREGCQMPTAEKVSRIPVSEDFGKYVGKKKAVFWGALLAPSQYFGP